MIEAVIFDKDGTLFDFQATWAAPFVAVIEAMPDAARRAMLAEALGIDMARRRFLPESMVIASTTEDVVATVSSVTGEAPEVLLARLNREMSQVTQVAPVPLGPCLSALKISCKLGLVTNDGEAPARRHLAQHGVLELFDFVAGYDSGFGAKPAPGQLLAFAQAVGVAPDRTLMVGDSRHDLEAGRAAGMIPVGVLTGVADEAELADLAQVVLPDIGHLAAWIADFGAADGSA